MQPAIAHTGEGEARRNERSEPQTQAAKGNPPLESNVDYLVSALAQLAETNATNALVVIPVYPGNALEVLRRARKQTSWLIDREGETLMGLGEREGDFLAGDERCQALSLVEKQALREPSNRFTHPRAHPSLATRLPLLFAGLSFAKGKATAPWEELREGRWTRPRWTFLSNGQEAVLAWSGDASSARASKAIREELESITQGLATPMKPASALASDTTADDTRDYEALVQRGVEGIQQGLLEKVVLARRVQRNLRATPEDVLARLPHAGVTRFFVRRGRTAFFGATPERLFQKRGTALLTEALAGTRRNGDESDDAELTSSAKDHAEHAFVREAIEAMLTSLGATSIQATEPALRRAANLVHLKTTITAELPEGVSAGTLLEAFHPTPAVGGTPRREALEFIANHEPSRGWYAGPIGWIDAHGDSEFHVALRSCVVTNGAAWAYAGAGIVAHSNPHSEAKETQLKLAPMLAALRGALLADSPRGALLADSPRGALLADSPRGDGL